MELEWTATLRNVLLGATLLGAVSGLVGSFALLRRQSLMGDALAHAALPGVGIAFLLTGSKHPLPILLGAAAAGVLGALLMLAVVRGSRIKPDSAMGIVLSVFFGAGIVLMTVIQRMPQGNKAGLDKFLFGQAATMLPRDVVVIAVLSAAVLGVVLLLYKEFKLLSFDPEFAASLGQPVRALEIALTVLLVVVVVVGLQMVGAILMVAALVVPAAAARQWTERLGTMLVLAVLLGAASGAGGAVVSAAVDKMPTGATIVILSSAVMVLSLLLAPQRGILWRGLRARRLSRRIRCEHLLKDLYVLGERAGDLARPLSPGVLMGVRGTGSRSLTGGLRWLRRRGWVEDAGGGVRLSPAGRTEAAQVVRKHRLWELYLSRRLELAEDHVHRPADDMEHALSDEAVEALAARLGHPTEDPHGQPIPPGRAA